MPLETGEETFLEAVSLPLKYPLVARESNSNQALGDAGP